MTKITFKTQKYSILLLNMYFRDLLCFFINILNLNKIRIQKCNFFQKKIFPRNMLVFCYAQYTKSIWLKISISRVWFYSKYIYPCMKKIKTQLLPLFAFQNHPSLTGIFKRNANFAIFHGKFAYFRATKKVKLKKIFFSLIIFTFKKCILFILVSSKKNWGAFFT